MLIIVLAVAGIYIAGYLMWGYTAGADQPLACGGSSDCDTVRNSAYAYLGGILPLPLLGLAGYLAILILSAAEYKLPSEWRYYAVFIVLGMALIGALYSAYLTYLEISVIRALCRWCMASAATMTLIFIASIFWLRQNTGVE